MKDDMNVLGLEPEWTIPNGQYSGIWGGTSYGQTCNPSFLWKKWTFSK